MGEDLSLGLSLTDEQTTGVLIFLLSSRKPNLCFLENTILVLTYCENFYCQKRKFFIILSCYFYLGRSHYWGHVHIHLYTDIIMNSELLTIYTSSVTRFVRCPLCKKIRGLLGHSIFFKF